MSERVPVRSLHRAGLAGALAVFFLGAAAHAPTAAGVGQGLARPAGWPVVVAQFQSPPGTLLGRVSPQVPWVALPPAYGVFDNTSLLALPGSRGTVQAKKAVRLSLLGALPDASGMPVLESAVIMSPKPAADLDITLDRGRVLLANAKPTGAAAIRVRFLDQTWDLTLAEAGTQVALERVGQWPPGVRFEKEPRPGHQPVTDVYLLLLKGRINLNDGTAQRALAGPVVYHWNSQQGVLGSAPLQKLPAWVNPEGKSPESDKALDAAAQRMRQRLAGGTVAAALRAGFDERDAASRTLAVYDAGAVGDLPLVLAALGDGKHAEVRDAAAATLRLWVGRAPGQDQKLFGLLVKDNYRPGQAEILLQLLHTFSAQDRDRPETYETLIDYLNHNQVAIRALAHWHLTRMVPRGREIAFNAAASAEERGRALAAWRRLVPGGKLPPRTP
jgi:hypothetical protein